MSWLVSLASSSMKGSLQSRLERSSWESPIHLAWDKAVLVDTQPIHRLETQLLQCQVINMVDLEVKISRSLDTTIKINLELEELMTLIPRLKALQRNQRFRK